MTSQTEKGHVAPDRAAQIVNGQNTRAERVAASRFVLRHARSREDLRDLLDELGLDNTTRRNQ